MTEIWAAIPGYEGWYEASTHGRVRSLPRTVHSKRGPKVFRGRLLKQQVYPKHYAMVGLHMCGVVVNASVHRLVLLTFVGPPPQTGMDGCHSNGDWYDNRLENLRWGTRKENIADCIRHGKFQRGDTHAFAKLTSNDVCRIREMALFRGSLFDIADLFGVHKNHINAILNRRKWAHLDSVPREVTT